MTIDIYTAEFDIDNCAAISVGKTFRQLIPPSRLTNPVKSAIVTFGFDPGCACHVIACFIGHYGASEAGFDGNQVQLKVGGNASYLIDQEGIVTDESTIDLSPTKTIIVSWYMAADGHQGCPISTNSSVDYNTWYRSINLAGQTDFPGPGLTADTNHIHLIKKIEGEAYPALTGTVKVQGVAAVRTVRSYVRSTGLLFATTVSAPDGTFTLSAPDINTDMYVVCLDDDLGEVYNALIYDRVRALV